MKWLVWGSMLLLAGYFCAAYLGRKRRQVRSRKYGDAEIVRMRPGSLVGSATGLGSVPAEPLGRLPKR